MAALALALAAVSCSDQTTAPDQSQAPSAQAPDFKKATLTGPIVQTVSGTISGDLTGTYQGVITLTQITQQGGQLFGTGTIVGTKTIDGVTTALNESFTAPLAIPSGRCPILHLDLGPIHLDLLGLEVDLSRVVLDITAVAGAGNLLGNLLCALVGLLDQFPLNLTGINLLLAQINAILGAIL
jgi:hypothetical protein